MATGFAQNSEVKLSPSAAKKQKNTLNQQSWISVIASYFFDWKTRDTTKIRLSKSRPEQKLAKDFRFSFPFLLNLIFIQVFFWKSRETRRCCCCCFQITQCTNQTFISVSALPIKSYFFIGKLVKPQDYVYPNRPVHKS